MSWYADDPVMTRLVAALPPPPDASRPDLYLALLESVVSQQLSVRVADIIFARFRALFAGGYPDAGTLLHLPAEQLRAAGLSGQKAAYLRNIAAFHLADPLEAGRLQSLSDEEIIARLTTIKGVGRWTVQMLLMFPMNRPDVFPIDDLGIRQSMIACYGLTETGKALQHRLLAIAARWQPHRTLACKYLWRARDAQA